MRNLIIIFTILPLLTFGQKEKRKPIETYEELDGYFYYRLDLFSDSTFKYEHSFELGSTISKGRWSMNNDTIILVDYEKPFKITSVSEKWGDTLSNVTKVQVVVDSLAALPFIEGIQEQYSGARKRLIPHGLSIWINNDCRTKTVIDEFGEAYFDTTEIFKISLDYDDYMVIDKTSNNLLIEISTFPIWTSPPTLIWTKWLKTKNEIKPIECGQTLENITLTKK